MTDLPATSDGRPGAVGVIRWQTEAPGPDDRQPAPEDESFGPASPRHANPQHGFWRRTVDTGQHALTSSSEALAIQIDLVAERMLAALEQRRADRDGDRAARGEPEPAWEANEIEVSFGLELANEVDVLVFTSGATASVNVTLKFTRTTRP